MLFSQGVDRLTSCFDVVEKLEWMRSGMLMLSVSGKKKERARNILFTFFIFYEDLFSLPSSFCRHTKWWLLIIPQLMKNDSFMRMTLKVRKETEKMQFLLWSLILDVHFFCQSSCLRKKSQDFCFMCKKFFQCYLLIRNGNWSGIYQIWCAIYSHSSSRLWWYQLKLIQWFVWFSHCSYQLFVLLFVFKFTCMFLTIMTILRSPSNFRFF